MYSKDSFHCSHTLCNISVEYRISNLSRWGQHTSWGVSEIRSPMKNYTACHLKFSTLWVKFFKEISDKSTIVLVSPAYITMLLSLSLCSFYLLPEHPTLLLPQLFSRPVTVQLQAWFSRQKTAVLNFPGSAPLRQKSGGTGGHTSNTPATGQHVEHLPPPPHGRAGMLCQFPVTGTSQANKRICAGLKLSGPVWTQRTLANYLRIKLHFYVRHFEWKDFLSEI